MDNINYIIKNLIIFDNLNHPEFKNNELSH